MVILKLSTETLKSSESKKLSISYFTHILLDSQKKIVKGDDVILCNKSIYVLESRSRGRGRTA